LQRSDTAMTKLDPPQSILAPSHAATASCRF
jgi:hypothetical protein